MRLAKLKAKNFKKLKLIELDFDENNNIVMLSGKNEQGKSTILDAVWAALGGASAIPSDPIRHGEKRATVELEIDDILVKRVITPKSQRLEVIQSGEKVDSPQTLLNNLISKIGLRPRAFAEADKDSQVEMLLEVIDVDLNLDKLSEIANTSNITKKNNPFDIIDDVYERLYYDRRDINRDKKKAKAELDMLEDVEEVKSVVISELIEEKDKLEDRNDEILEKEEDVRKYEDYIVDLNKDINSLEQQIAELQIKLGNLKKERKESASTLDTMNKNLSTMLDEYQDNEDRLQEINNEIKQADETNAKAQKWKEKVKAQEKYDKYKAESDIYTERLDRISKYKEELMAKTKFPIKGLSFKDGEIFYKGVPLAQASKTEKLQVSFAVVKKMDPELKLVLIEDGNTVDREHMDVIRELARDKNYLVLMEYMDESETVGIVIEDGSVVMDNYEEDPWPDVAI